MSDTQKTIQILEGLPDEITAKLSMKDIFETLTIMLAQNENDNFEPTVNDFLEALSIKISLKQAIDDIENGGKTYTTEEIKKELEL